MQTSIKFQHPFCSPVQCTLQVHSCRLRLAITNSMAHTHDLEYNGTRCPHYNIWHGTCPSGNIHAWLAERVINLREGTLVSPDCSGILVSPGCLHQQHENNDDSSPTCNNYMHTRMHACTRDTCCLGLNVDEGWDEQMLLLARKSYTGLLADTGNTNLLV